ncbi:MAG TPA: hypothetical protein VN847_19225, partial [Streptosporangiaceae bacterium]|nr:hypothetical protein [Streptosporangiaceae bacterium]
MASAHTGLPTWPHPLAVVPPADPAGRTRRVKRTGFALDATGPVCSADGRDDGKGMGSQASPIPEPEVPPPEA